MKKEQVIQANIELHTQLASVYNRDEPHFRPENVATVKSRLQRIQNETRAKTLLDIGCGTGFLISIAKTLPLQKIIGVDITPAMIEQVDKTGAVPIETHLSDVSQMPVADQSVEIVSAYSFIDHLYDLQATFKEVRRCLKADGVFYAGLIPNELFWQNITSLPRAGKYSAAIEREIVHVADKPAEASNQYGVNAETFKVAEYQKNVLGGLGEDRIRNELRQAGFGKVEFVYDWFLGQGLINNDSSLSADSRKQQIDTIDQYLRGQLPLSKGLYKYMSFFASS